MSQTQDYSIAKNHQPTINIGMIGSVSNGKSSITEKLTGIKTQKHSKELERNITIKLGYANAKIYKCPNCPSPSCYQPHPSSIMTANCKFCDIFMELIRHISLVDCFDPNTEVLMFDGTTNKVNDLQIGNELIGPDGTKRIILQLMEGEKDMYKINYTHNSKKTLDKKHFICTGGHLLALRIDTPVTTPEKKNNGYAVRTCKTNDTAIYTKQQLFPTLEEATKYYEECDKKPITFKMTVEAFLQSPKKTLKQKARLYYADCLEFDNHPLAENLTLGTATEEEIGWLIGLWLGDGVAVKPHFSIGFADNEIIEKLKILAPKLNLFCEVNKCTNDKKAYDVLLSTQTGQMLHADKYLKNQANKNSENVFSMLLKKLGLWDNKHIGNNLKFQKKSVRRAILAGMIDSDGYYGKGQFEIIQSIDHKPIIEGLIWIIKSLGFTCHYKQKYNATKNGKVEHLRLTFSGKASDLPICLSRKHGVDITRNWTTSQPFTVEKLGVGKYKGFTVDKDQNILLADHIIASNCPGHSSLMATMLNGTCVMDNSILVESASNTELAQQTKEHLLAIGIAKLPNSIACLNKLDLVKKEVAIDRVTKLQQQLKGTLAENSPVIPIAANYGINIDVLCEYICKYIDEPVRQYNKGLKMIIVRSFNINKQDTSYETLQGGVIGGTIMKGVIKVGDKIAIYPGIISKNESDKWQYKPLTATVQSINSETTNIEYAIPGGLIGIKLDIDPGLTVNDKLIGNIVTTCNNTEFDILETLFVELELINKEEIIQKKDVFIINSNACNEKCEITYIDGNNAKLKLMEKPICIQVDDYITLSKYVNSNICVIGRGIVRGGIKSIKIS